ncbi:MAG: TfoX/Sxy family protein [Deltaproteobacteria bacterium]|nr:TfoX/Sxy family protein [Deltaproteobacteria bacterium]
MAYNEKLAARIRKAFGASNGITEKKMFGGLCFLENGSMCCGIVGAELMVRVGPEAYEGALMAPYARPMDFTKKPMRGFVYVATEGCATQARVTAWVARGRAFVAKLAARPTVEDDLRELLKDHRPKVQQLTSAARMLLKKVVPAAVESVRPGWKLLGFSAPRYFAFVMPMNDHVRVGFEHGVLLDDQWDLLEPGGKQVKWLTVRKAADLKRPGVAALMAEAAELALRSKAAPKKSSR